VTQALFDKYYPKSRFEGGTLPFFRLCREKIPSGVATRDLEPWAVYHGVPSVKIKERRRTS
jgi:hypothetical protein